MFKDCTKSAPLNSLKWKTWIYFKVLKGQHTSLHSYSLTDCGYCKGKQLVKTYLSSSYLCSKTEMAKGSQPCGRSGQQHLNYQCYQWYVETESLHLPCWKMSTNQLKRTVWVESRYSMLCPKCKLQWQAGFPLALCCTAWQRKQSIFLHF